RKLDEKTAQTSPTHPNVIVMSLYMGEAAMWAYELAVNDFFAGRSMNYRYESQYPQFVERIESVILYGRHRVLSPIVNPTAAPAFRLSDDTRRSLVTVLESGDVLIR